MDARSVLRLDLGGHRTLGLGAVSLWPLGVRGWVLGVDAGARGGAAGLCARPRRLLRRAQGGRGHQYRRAGRGLGAARMGGAGRAVVGGGRRSEGGSGWGGGGGGRASFTSRPGGAGAARGL